jgi:circadian clock protein KaiC
MGLIYRVFNRYRSAVFSPDDFLVQYVAAAVERGEKAAMFIFDEELGLLFERSSLLGFDFETMIKDGNLVVEQVDAAELSPGEFAHRVRERVDTANAKTVAIDSLNGYLNAIPQVEAPLVRLHELLSFLNESDIATIIVVAQHGVVGARMTTPLDVSYLADSVVLLRFFEARGTVRRALSVMKKRTGTHEASIRELVLGPERIHVGKALTEFQGILSGIPHYVGAADALGNEQA